MVDYLRILTYNDRFGGGGIINDLSGVRESSSQHLACTLRAHVKFCNKSATKGLIEFAHNIKMPARVMTPQWPGVDSNFLLPARNFLPSPVVELDGEELLDELLFIWPRNRTRRCMTPVIEVSSIL